MIRISVCVLCMLLGSCTALEKLQKIAGDTVKVSQIADGIVDKGRDVIATGKQIVDQGAEYVARYKDAAAKADLDGSGGINGLDEWKLLLMLLLGTGGSGAAAVSIANKGRRSATGEVHERINDQAKQIADLKADLAAKG